MRNALQALQQNEARYRGTIAGLQKDNQILSVLVANTLYNNSSVMATPAPRKKPFMSNLFRRNEQKTPTTNITPLFLGDGDNTNLTGVSPCAGGIDPASRDYSPAVKSSSKRHGGRNTNKGSSGISYPSEVRHVVHVPSGVVFETNHELHRESLYLA